MTTPFESWKTAISREMSKEDEMENNRFNVVRTTPMKKKKRVSNISSSMNVKNRLIENVASTKSNVRLATPKAVRNVFLAPRSLEKENKKKRNGNGERPRLGQDLFSEPKKAQMKNRKSGRKADSSSSRKFRRPFEDMTKRRNIDFDYDDDDDGKESGDGDLESGRFFMKGKMSYDVMIVVQRSGTSYRESEDQVDMTQGMRSRKEKAARRLAAAAGDSIAITRIKLEEAGFHVSSPHCLNRLEKENDGETNSNSNTRCCSLTECFVRLGAEDWDSMLCCRGLRKKLSKVLGNDNLVLLRAYASKQSIVRVVCFRYAHSRNQHKKNTNRYVTVFKIERTHQRMRSREIDSCRDSHQHSDSL